MPEHGHIGLSNRVVKLVDHDPAWAECFKQEKKLLLAVCAGRVLDIRHVGSTSIPGIPAKPVIDMIAAVRTLSDVETLARELNEIGYTHKGNGDVPGRRYFVKGPPENRTHHLNCCEPNSPFWRSHLAFRDYLASHPEAAAEYAGLKLRLAQQFPTDRLAYTNGKEEFVLSVTQRAMQDTKNKISK